MTGFVLQKLPARRRLAFALAFAGLCAMFWAQMAGAQGASQPLVAQQKTAFTAMYAAPRNPRAILDYAKASAATRDFEAVAAALERLVALEPANVAARKELALAYFALGSNAMAQHHFEIVAAAGGQDPAFAARVQDYRAKAAMGRDKTQIKGVLRFGTVASKSAAPLPDADFSLTWRRDMGAARGHVWLSQLALAHSWAANAGQVNAYSASVQTGPQFALGTARGDARLQVFALASARGNLDGDTRHSTGAGAALHLPLGAQGSLSFEANTGRAQVSQSLTEGQFAGYALQASYRVAPQTTLRLKTAREMRSGLSTGAQTEQSAAIEVWHEFRPRFSRIDRNWRVIAALQRSDVAVSNTDTSTTVAGFVLRSWLGANSFSDISISETRGSDGLGGSSISTRFGLRFGLEF